jgi:hypothetical protein
MDIHQKNWSALQTVPLVLLASDGKWQIWGQQLMLGNDIWGSTIGIKGTYQQRGL